MESLRFWPALHTVGTRPIPLLLPSQNLMCWRSKQESGIPPKKIMSKVRARWTPSEARGGQGPLCYISMKHISNIAHRLVEGGSSSRGDGFLLGKDYTERCWCRGLVLEDTFNVTRYSFRLATLMITDDAGNVFSCGHLLSYRLTSEEVQALFRIVEDVNSTLNFWSPTTPTFSTTHLWQYSPWARKPIYCAHFTSHSYIQEKKFLKVRSCFIHEDRSASMLFD